MKVKVEVSNRHVHLSKKVCEELFSKKFKLTVRRELSQKGEFSSNTALDIKTEKGMIEHVRVVGPLRNYTQVEISRSDAEILGLNPPMRNSGELENSESITLLNSKKEIFIENCVILANRHLHINEEEAKKNKLENDQIISATINGKKMDDIHVKIGSNYTTALHVDKDDEREYNITLDTYADIDITNKKLMYIIGGIVLFLVLSLSIFLYVMIRIFENYVNVL